jgi:hypothetical protein
MEGEKEGVRRRTRGETSISPSRRRHRTEGGRKKTEEAEGWRKEERGR